MGYWRLSGLSSICYKFKNKSDQDKRVKIYKKNYNFMATICVQIVIKNMLTGVDIPPEA